MKPTNHLRYEERRIKMPPFYVAPDGGPAYQIVHVLQQWWEDCSTDVYVPSSPSGSPGLWRDVDVVKEEVSGA